jgi:hypothetical protein
VSDARDKKITLWDGIIEYDQPVPSARVEAVRAAIDAGLLNFERHKEALLDILRRARNPEFEPLEEDKWWRRVTNLAGIYFWEQRVKQYETLPSGDRAKRLLILARALGKACSLTDKAMGDDVGDALFSAWQEETGVAPVSIVRNDDGSFSRMLSAMEKFKKEVAGLAPLEVAAKKAADEARRERVGGGRPRGTSALSPGYILALAEFYGESTATEAATGGGSFVKFVRVFLDAVGQKDRVTERHLIGTIEDALARERKSPTGPLPSSNSRE